MNESVDIFSMDRFARRSAFWVNTEAVHGRIKGHGSGKDPMAFCPLPNFIDWVWSFSGRNKKKPLHKKTGATQDAGAML